MQITMRSVGKIYESEAGNQVVLDGLNFTISDGEVVVIVGRSGSGKSTFLNLLGQMDVPTTGTINIDGANSGEWNESERNAFRRQHLGFVFQRFNLVPTLTIEENIRLPLELNGIANSSRVEKLCGQLGIAALLKRYPDQLSGGEQQRTAIARALAHRPSIVVADEPTGNLDHANGRAVVELLLEAARNHGAALIMATHSEDMTGKADRILELYDGNLTPVSR